MKIPRIALFSQLLVAPVAYTPAAFAATDKPVDDLIVQSRLDGRSANWIIENTRLILANSDQRDGLSGTVSLDDESTFSMDELIHDPGFQQIKKTISRVFNLNVDSAYIRIRIPGLSYSIHRLQAEPRDLSVNDPLLTVSTTARLQGVDIGLPDGIQIDFMIPNRKTGVPGSLITASLNPVSITIPESLPPAEFNVNLEARRGETFNLALKGYNLDSIPGYVDQHLDSILTLDSATRLPFTEDGIKVAPVVVRLNQLSRTFTSVSYTHLRAHET
ncbi:MAG: hypothetical protein EBX52_11950, partial [Proteobacteria bacterium]|nr:hypothetical protein [Pseudomonadota bacterium]